MKIFTFDIILVAEVGTVIYRRTIVALNVKIFVFYIVFRKKEIVVCYGIALNGMIVIFIFCITSSLALALEVISVVVFLTSLIDV